MNRLPLLPFACSIVSGKLHTEVQPIDDVTFNGDYYERLHETHQNDIPQLLTEKLAKELFGFVDNVNKNLTGVMFGRMLVDEAQGVVCVPTWLNDNTFLVYTNIAYKFIQDEGILEITISVTDCSDMEHTDIPFLTYTAERLPDSLEIGINLPADVSIPIMAMGNSLDRLDYVALYWVKFICAFESMFIYRCIDFKGFLYDAMLTNKGVCINPNVVSVNLVALDGEKKSIP